MKRLFLCILITALLAGCKPTPEEPVVVGKDQGAMLEAAARESVRSIAEQVNAPLAYRVNAIGAGGKLDIIAQDAPIEVPKAEQLSIFRVTAADFTQAETNAMLNALFSGAVLYEAEYGVATKDEIMERILLCRQQKEKDENASPSEQRWLDEEIAMLEEEYRHAPETSENSVTVSDRRLKLMEVTGPDGGHLSYFRGIELRADPDAASRCATFHLENNNDMTEPVWHPDDGEGSMGYGTPLYYCASMSYNNPVNAEESSFTHVVRIDMQAPTAPKAAAEKLNTTPAQAKALVERTLQAAGVEDMVTAAIFLTDDRQSGEPGGEPLPAENYAYKLFLRRVVNGVPVSYIDGGISGIGAFNASIVHGKADAMADAFAATYMWYYETFAVTVNDAGIIDLAWKSPLNIGEALVERAALLSFADISQVFESLMRMKYGPKAMDESLQSFSISVERVALEYQRIIEQDSNPNGLLIPVWNFYGSCTGQKAGGEAYIVRTGGGDYQFPLASINAVDGSVIDISRGY